LTCIEGQKVPPNTVSVDVAPDPANQRSLFSLFLSLILLEVPRVSKSSALSLAYSLQISIASFCLIIYGY
jgi:hypothetical protein